MPMKEKLPVSLAEDLMIQVLRRSKQPITIRDIVEKIRKMDDTVLAGATPERSLYSIIYRREWRRTQLGQAQVFLKSIDNGIAHYSLINKQ